MMGLLSNVATPKMTGHNKELNRPDAPLSLVVVAASVAATVVVMGLRLVKEL